jgi:hypothetical protein
MVILLTIFGLQAFLGCENSEVSTQNFNTEDSLLIDFVTVPKEWKSGDSVRIYITSRSECAGVKLSQSEFSIKAKFAQPQTTRHGINSEILIVPIISADDTLDYQHAVEVLSSFAFPEKGFSIFKKENYNIVDTADYYFFLKDENSIKIDTLRYFDEIFFDE